MSSDKNLKKGAIQMMNESVIKKTLFYKVNLSQVEGEGSFPCPKCGTMISPDDESEEVYKIVDTKVVNDELVEVIITCNTCGTIIKLTGFNQFMENSSIE
jgi:predicted RNA-binding Zn-ribbon protein involved in translation (DUF1610 family)